MPRPRSFDERHVVAAARELFVRLGYEATSVDDLVRATGLHRGSLYQAFASKRGIFLAALHQLVDEELPAADAVPGTQASPAALDLLLVAALELAPRDEQVRVLLQHAVTLLAARAPGTDPHAPATLLGRRLLERATAFPARP